MGDWIKALTIGDTVIVSERANKTIDTVDKLTKIYIALKKTNTKYDRAYGISICSDIWNMSHLEEATKEAIVRVKGRMDKKQ